MKLTKLASHSDSTMGSSTRIAAVHRGLVVPHRIAHHVFGDDHCRVGERREHEAEHELQGRATAPAATGSSRTPDRKRITSGSSSRCCRTRASQGANRARSETLEMPVRMP